MDSLFDFMQHVYGLFGFEFQLELSTRPDNYLGDIETWNFAEDVRAFAFCFSRMPLTLEPFCSN